MFESKLILKLPPFSRTVQVREKGGNFKMSLLSNILRLFLNCLGFSLKLASFKGDQCPYRGNAASHVGAAVLAHIRLDAALR